jgi:hypothetical protein
MAYEEVDYEPTDDEVNDTTLPARKMSPYRKKQLDYKHQVRFISSGNRGYRRASKELPHNERRSYRHALEATVHAAQRDEDAELTSADDLKLIRRSKYTRFMARKTIRLREAVQLKQEHRAARANKHKAKGTSEDSA